MTPTDPNIYWMGEVEFLGATESDSVGRVLRLKLIRSARDLNLANPFQKATRKRRGHAGTRFQLSLAPVEALPEKYAGEALLLNWSDGPKGSTATMLLDTEADVHPFMSCRRGSRFMGVWIEITDEETVVNTVINTVAEKLEESPPWEEGQDYRTSPLSVQARLLTKNQKFRDYLGSITGELHGIERADSYIKGYCKVESKSDIKEGSPAGDRLLQLKAQYHSWLVG